MANIKAKAKVKGLPVPLLVIQTSHNPTSDHDINTQILAPARWFHNAKYYFELIWFSFRRDPTLLHHANQRICH
jgi:hypothetical protein